MNVLKEIWQFLKSKRFIANALIALALLALLLFGTFFMLKQYTNHGKTYAVPNLSGMTLDEAKDFIKKKPFKLMVIDSSFFANKKANEVISQDPLPDDKVKKNRSIYITINNAVAPPTTIPNVLGKDYKFGRRTLEAHELRVDTVLKEFDRAVGTILKIRYDGKTYTLDGKNQTVKYDRADPPTLPKNSSVTVVIAKGDGGEVSVPSVVGMSLEAAGFTLENYALQIGSMLDDGTITSSEKGRIYKQDPGSGSFVSMGSEVTIWLTEDTDRILDRKNITPIDTVNQ